jgi:hypothetical protein
MASAAFDPYHKWLGIPPHEQPPNLYRLLGVSLFESDADVIAYAADQRMTLLRSIASGPHSGLSQRLLNEIAAAKITLLKPEKKQAYDAELRAKQLPPAMPTQDVAAVVPATTDIASFAAPIGPAGARIRRTPQSRSRGPLMWIGFAVVSCAAIAGLLYALNQQGQRPQQAKRDNPKETKQDAADNTAIRTEFTEGEASESNPAGKLTATTNRSGTANSQDVDGETPGPRAQPEKKSKNRGRLKKDGPKQPVDGQAARVQQPANNLPDPPQPPIANPAAEAAKRVAIPTADELARVEKAIEDLMKADFAKAKNNPLKAELARRLFELAKGTRDDAAAAYVQPRKGIDLAAESGQNDLAWEMIDTLAERFDVDDLAEKEKSLTTVGRLAKNAEQNHALAETWVLLTREAIERDDYELAMRTANEARRTARLSADAVFVKIVESSMQNLQHVKDAYAVAKPAKERLVADSDDAEAAAMWGRFLCAFKNDWTAGLPLWAKTSDVKLADLLKRDLAAPADNEARVKLGDEWFAAADSETETLPRQSLKARAAHWYKEALPQLSGLTKVRLEKRIEEIYEATSPFVRGQVVNVLGLVNPKHHALRGEWGRRGNQLGLVTPVPSGLIYVPVSIRGDYELILEFRRGKDDLNWINVYLPVAGGRSRLHLALGDKPKVVYGEGGINSPDAQAVATKLVSGGRHRLKASIKSADDRAQVMVEINGRRSLAFDGQTRPLSIVDRTPPATIALESGDPTVIYESALLRIISGTAELTP